MLHLNRIQAFLLILLSLTLSSCDDEGDNFIDGSLVKNYNIEYDNVRVRLFDNSFAVEYLSKKKVAALRISIDATEAKIAKGKTYDLERYGTVTRYEDYGELPELESGELTIDTFSGKDGDPVSGSFHARLVSDGESTQTLRGAFKSSLEVVPL
jgi:hypothetical protein